MLILKFKNAKITLNIKELNELVKTYLRMKKTILLSLTILISYFVNAQNNRTITTAVPFLLISADARASGMGDQGVATSVDAFAQQWNPAKYAFAQNKQGFSVSYTPYLSNITNDIALSQATYYNKINNRSAFATSLRYFGLGEIELRQSFDDMGVTVKPNELALDLSYSLKLSEYFSMAVAARYIRSNLKIPNTGTDASSANTFAVDIAGFYQSEEVTYSKFDGIWRAGFNIQNLGPKISYDEDKDLNSDFLPTNLKLGAGFDFIFNADNKIGINIEFNKLLVPTPKDFNHDGIIDGNDNEKYRKAGWVSGIFKSFGDAPDGFSEELKEITYALGTEYLYKDTFALRMGYFNESNIKGARKFFSLGTGFKYNIATLDFAYMFATSKIKNPLENTLRFSLTLNFGDSVNTTNENTTIE